MIPDVLRRAWIVDLVAALGLAAVAARFLAAVPGPPAEGLPVWASGNDAYIWGPDAGGWALNTLAFASGRWEDLDPHRMPTWSIFTATLMHISGLDVALAGHLLNKLFHVLLGPAIYLLGRAMGMRAGAAAAGLLAVAQPELLAAAGRYGIDPTVTFLVPFTLLSAWASGRWWMLAPIGGVIAGFTTVCHLTALGFAVPGLLLVLTCGRGWWRLLAAVLYAAAAVGTVYGVYSIFPTIPEGFLVDVFAEGIAPAAGTTPVEQVQHQADALATLQANAPLAFDSVVALVVESFRVRGLPWGLLLALPWLGLFGPPALEEIAVGDRSLPRRFARAVWIGVASGLPVACALAPLLALQAADAPSRYSDNLLPVAGLLVMRGLSLLASPVSMFVARFLSIHAALLLEALAFTWVAWAAWPIVVNSASLRMGVPPDEARAMPVGRALAEHFESGIGAASPLREALPYAGMVYCPTTVCPFSDNEQGYLYCVQVIRKECRGDGDIPYVVTPGLTPEQQTEPRRHMDAWIAEKLEPVAEVGSTKIYAIPREGSF
ncbi:MAG: hypothetical protein FJ090_17470 [Deltaproteobacteria bacterium]|nr:hypothetical protein [Deltaproteobacteria bacterium]